MPIHDLLLVVLITGAFCLLGGMLAWADWQETWAKKAKARTAGE